MTDSRLYAPATLRNRGPILDALRPRLPPRGLVLEVASGTGEHAAHLAAALPHLVFQPTDPDPAHRASIAAWTSGLPNVHPPLALDASAPDWPVRHADAVLCINMVHIAPWAATEGLVAGAARVLPPCRPSPTSLRGIACGDGGPLFLYGPYTRDGRHTAPSNAAFDADLRARDPAWGVRDLGDVARLAGAAGFGAAEVVPMPANNLLVAFHKT